MLKEGTNQGGTFLQRTQESYGVTLEMVGSAQGQPTELVLFEVIPHQLVRIQVRAIRR